MLLEKLVLLFVMRRSVLVNSILVLNLNRGCASEIYGLMLLCILGYCNKKKKSGYIYSPVGNSHAGNKHKLE